MADPRLRAVAAVVARLRDAIRWLARMATVAAALGAAGGLLLWWASGSDQVTEWWQGTLGSLLTLAVCLAPAGWLVNVRFALLELAELPDKVSGVATRRFAELRPSTELERPPGGVVGTVRSVRGVVRDYGDVVGSWGTVAQLVVPWFWFLTLAALVAVPLLFLLAAVAGLVAGLST